MRECVREREVEWESDRVREWAYRGTSLIRNSPSPHDHHRTLEGWGFLMNEVPLYPPNVPANVAVSTAEALARIFRHLICARQRVCERERETVCV
jgi:hypothetical protein